MLANPRMRLCCKKWNLNWGNHSLYNQNQKMRIAKV